MVVKGQKNKKGAPLRTDFGLGGADVVTLNKTSERALGYRRMAKAGLNPRFNAQREMPSSKKSPSKLISTVCRTGKTPRADGTVVALLIRHGYVGYFVGGNQDGGDKAKWQKVGMFRPFERCTRVLDDTSQELKCGKGKATDPQAVRGSADDQGQTDTRTGSIPLHVLRCSTMRIWRHGGLHSRYAAKGQADEPLRSLRNARRQVREQGETAISFSETGSRHAQ